MKNLLRFRRNEAKLQEKYDQVLRDLICEAVFGGPIEADLLDSIVYHIRNADNTDDFVHRLRDMDCFQPGEIGALQQIYVREGEIKQKSTEGEVKVGNCCAQIRGAVKAILIAVVIGYIADHNYRDDVLEALAQVKADGQEDLKLLGPWIARKGADAGIKRWNDKYWIDIPNFIKIDPNFEEEFLAEIQRRNKERAKDRAEERADEGSIANWVFERVYQMADAKVDELLEQVADMNDAEFREFVDQLFDKK